MCVQKKEPWLKSAEAAACAAAQPLGTSGALPSASRYETSSTTCATYAAQHEPIQRKSGICRVLVDVLIALLLSCVACGEHRVCATRAGHDTRTITCCALPGRTMETKQHWLQADLQEHAPGTGMPASSQ